MELKLNIRFQDLAEILSWYVITDTKVVGYYFKCAVNIELLHN